MRLELGERTDKAVALERVSAQNWEARAKSLAPAQARQAEAQKFSGKPNTHFLLFDAAGALERVFFGDHEPDAPERNPLALGRLAPLLPAGRYRLAPPCAALDALAFLMGAYRFDAYRKPKPCEAVLEAPEEVDADDIARIAQAMALGRDLINTPANDMGPQELEDAARALAARHGAAATTIAGAALKAGFPLAHAVGKGAARAPRLVDLFWSGAQNGPRLTLVGKGVVFDTGGLDIKPDAAMLLMKKDMGGAAAALAAADMIMGARLPLNLRVILPIVENAVSGEAFRPGDVYPSRKGLTVEIGNTDAEGRLILADALAFADEEAPDLLIDFATLTGAARVALGPDLPPFFTDNDALARDIEAAARKMADPVWRLPLWAPYASGLDGKIADLNNVAPGGFAGAIVAALFLKKFVERAKAYAHFDIYGWTPSARPGRPEGGEAQAARLVYELARGFAR
jgi:leucyl aminopeptidase